MSYDFDYVEIDWYEGEYTIYSGMNYYTYSIKKEPDLLYGTLNAGVEFDEKGGDYDFGFEEEDKHEDDGYDDYDERYEEEW